MMTSHERGFREAAQTAWYAPTAVWRTGDWGVSSAWKLAGQMLWHGSRESLLLCQSRFALWQSIMTKNACFPLSSCETLQEKAAVQWAHTLLRVLPGAAMRPQMAGGTTGCPGAEEGTISYQYEHRCFCSLRDPQGRNSERDWKIASTSRGNTSPLTGLRGTENRRQKLTRLMMACHRTCLFIPGMAAYVPYMYTVT